MLDKSIIDAENKWAQLVVTNAKSILLRNKKIATGALYESIKYRVDLNGKIHFIFAKEGKYVESGRRKGARQPPVRSILSWIKTKGIQGRDKTTGRFITDRSLAFIIARGISKNGIKPVKFISGAIKQARKQLAGLLRTSIVKATIKDIGKLKVSETIKIG